MQRRLWATRASSRAHSTLQQGSFDFALIVQIRLSRTSTWMRRRRPTQIAVSAPRRPFASFALPPTLFAPHSCCLPLVLTRVLLSRANAALDVEEKKEDKMDES